MEVLPLILLLQISFLVMILCFYTEPETLRKNLRSLISFSFIRKNGSSSDIISTPEDYDDLEESLESFGSLKTEINALSFEVLPDSNVCCPNSPSSSLRGKETLRSSPHSIEKYVRRVLRFHSTNKISPYTFLPSSFSSQKGTNDFAVFREQSRSKPYAKIPRGWRARTKVGVPLFPVIEVRE